MNTLNIKKINVLPRTFAFRVSLFFLLYVDGVTLRIGGLSVPAVGWISREGTVPDIQSYPACTILLGEQAYN